MTHRGPFQPLLFCDSVIQSQADKYHSLASYATYFSLSTYHVATSFWSGTCFN